MGNVNKAFFAWERYNVFGQLEPPLLADCEVGVRFLFNTYHTDKPQLPQAVRNTLTGKYNKQNQLQLTHNILAPFHKKGKVILDLFKSLYACALPTWFCVVTDTHRWPTEYVWYQIHLSRTMNNSDLELLQLE